MGNLVSETTFDHWKVVFSRGKVRKRALTQNSLIGGFDLLESNSIYIFVHENVLHPSIHLIQLYRFEGFAIDLADALSKILHFNYTFKIVDDGKVLMSRK